MCPICGCRRYCEFFAKGQRALLICYCCRHVWWDHFPAEGELREYYQLQYTQLHGQEAIQAGANEYYRGHLQALLHLIGKEAADTQLCDYGCSIPVLLREARRAGFRRALGVDFSQEARAQTDVEVFLPEQLPGLPDASLDIVRFSHTLEHCVDPVETLAQVLKKVRTGGLVYVTQPNFPVFGFGASSRDLKDTIYPEHLHFFSPISLLETARRLDLEVRQFFTHQNEEQVLANYEDQLDLEYARLRLAPFEAKGEPSAHTLGNYPYYAGENSVLYAFKKPE